MLSVEEVQPRPLVAGAQRVTGLVSEAAYPVGVPVRSSIGLAALREPRRRILADRLEQPVPRIAVRQGEDHRLVDQPGERSEHVHVVPDHHLGGVEAEPAGKYGEPSEGGLLVEGEQVVAPVEGRPDGALPVGKVASARRADRLVQAGQQGVGAEQPGVRRGELESQRQTVELTADRGDGGGGSLGEGERRRYRMGPVEQHLAGSAAGN